MAGEDARRKRLAVALSCAVALVIALGAWATQAGRGSALLATVEPERSAVAGAATGEGSDAAGERSGSGVASDGDGAEGATGKASDKASSKAADKAGGKAADKASDKAADKAGAKDDAKATGKADSAADNARDASADKDGSAARSGAGDSGSAATGAGSSADAAPVMEQGGEQSAPAAEPFSTPAPAVAEPQPAPAPEPEPEPEPQPTPTTLSVRVVVDGTPAGGGLRDVTVTLPLDANVYDALVASGAGVNARATGYGTYVAAIDGLAEKDHGSMSGWVYAVNGVEPQTACSNYHLSDGDTVVWTYVNVEY